MMLLFPTLRLLSWSPKARRPHVVFDADRLTAVLEECGCRTLKPIVRAPMRDIRCRQGVNSSPDEFDHRHGTTDDAH